ncbi:YcbK family protein [Nitratireductor luteus]|uniref:YcbK family protein n=1 Tax=Nitratireductor luteus TaxID=2976980 RepID=UPI002240A320|nr:D-Ala-D-Ala carboxypeptidase family metallohydrolase [Nitratireductor luteus]
MGAVLAMIMLASCSASSDPVAQLGLAPAEQQTAAADGEADGGVSLFQSASGDQEIAALPTPRPGSQTEPEDENESQSAEAAEEPAQVEIAQAAADPRQAVAEKPAQPETAQPVEQAAAEDALPPQEATETTAADAALEKKRGFLSAFFSPRQPAESEQPTPVSEDKPIASEKKEEAEETKPLITLASASATSSPFLASADPLPGVRQGDNLFEIKRKSDIDDDSDLDLYEEEGSYQVASAAGLARLAPNGLLTQRESVDVSCLKPALLRTVQTIERHYGKKVVVTSGYRSPSHNRRVRGARNSLHMYCAAVDIQIPGVSKWELAKFARSMPGRGGVGTYCHTKSVHVDIGPERDWNWRCRRKR